MASGKSTGKVAMEFKPNHSSIKAYAVYGKVSRKTPNRVTTTNLTVHDMR